MTQQSAEMAARRMDNNGLVAASGSPGTFARAHDLTVADAIPVLTRESALRKSHKIWRK